MPWGTPAFSQVDEKLVTGYTPASGLPGATYQTVQWQNYIQVFTSAIATKTGPAVSSGGGTQPFLLDKQGSIVYADNLYESWKSNGMLNDFLPGVVDMLKTPKGYVSVPYNLDLRVMWYNKSLLEQAGTSVPTDWQSYLDACEALKKIGVYGYGTSSGSGANLGWHGLMSWMINNGGGLFDENRQPNCVTPQNIATIDFVLECVSKGYVDPAVLSYTTQNGTDQWKAKKFGMGIEGRGLAANVGGDVQASMSVMSPLKSPSGKKGFLLFPNSIMMYTNTPSQKGSEDFVTYYYKNMSQLWTQPTGAPIPVLKSIAQTPQFQADVNAAKIVQEWQPAAGTLAAPGGTALFGGVTAIDGGTTLVTQFTQSVLSGKTNSKSALQTLQDGLKTSASS